MTLLLAMFPSYERKILPIVLLKDKKFVYQDQREILNWKFKTQCREILHAIAVFSIQYFSDTVIITSLPDIQET